jgi:hypothetical protein
MNVEDQDEIGSVQSWLKEIDRDIMYLTAAIFPQDYGDSSVTYPEIGAITSLTDAVVFGAIHIAKSIDKLTAAVEAISAAKEGPVRS